ncbi:MAG: T9SS type A sorting domain-containing protein [Bacteroidetes bacterium]|nr:T9SS type A sorting domain-containing protein [Bacteroidota bacterium]
MNIKIFVVFSLAAKIATAQLALPCNNNLYCDPAYLNPIPADVYTKNARSVMMIYTPNGGGQCTATLLRQIVGDDNQQQNIIITARHCIHQGDNGFGPLADINNMEIEFNYSNPDCNVVPNPPYKTGRYKLKGATLIDESLFNDIAILKLNQPIPPHFQPYYSGWTASPLISPSGAYFDIHHAAEDIKKISSTTIPIALNAPIPYRINAIWTNGVTEQGSSGSALFNYNRRVIGAASFGLSNNNNCSNGVYVNFGRFLLFWMGSPATRSVLRPNNNNNPFILGNSGGEIECYKGDLNLNGKYWPAGDYQPNNIITIKCEGNMFLAQPGGSTNNLTVYPGAEFNFEAGGQIIKAQPGFYAMAGSIVSIKPNMACTPMRMMNSIDPSDIDSNSVNYYYDESKGELPKEGMYSAKPVSTLQIFPNPNKGVFKVKSLGYKTEPHTFELIDVNGRIIYSVSSNYFDNGEEESFSFTDLPGGVYMLKIENEVSKNAEYKRVIIQK